MKRKSRLAGFDPESRLRKFGKSFRKRLQHGEAVKHVHVFSPDKIYMRTVTEDEAVKLIEDGVAKPVGEKGSQSIVMLQLREWGKPKKERVLDIGKLKKKVGERL
jgi:hypothetical protein